MSDEMLPVVKREEQAVKANDKNVPFDANYGTDKDIDAFFEQQVDDGLAGTPINLDNTDPQAINVAERDPIESFFDERNATDVRNTLEAVKHYDPEQFARAKRLGEKYGLDGRAVYDNIDLLETGETPIAKSVNKALQNQPNLAQLYKDPEFAAVAQSDPDLLDDIQDYGSAGTHGIVSGVGEGIFGLGHISESTQKLASDAFNAMFPQFDDLPTAAKVAAKMALPAFFNQMTSDALIKGGDAITQFSNETFKLSPEESSYGTEVVEAMGQMTSQIAMTIMAPWVAVPMIAGQGGAQQARRIEQLEKSGVELSEQDKAGAILTGGAITGLTEFGPMKLITRSLPKPLRDKVGSIPGANVLERVLNRLPGPQRNIVLERLRTGFQAAGAEGAQEFIEGILQEVASQLWLIEDMTVMQGLEKELGDILHGSGVAATSAGTMDLLIALAFKRRGQATIVENQKAQATTDSLDQLADIVSDSTLQKMAPEEFKRLMAEKFGDETIKIDNEGINELFQSMPPEDQAELLDSIDGLEEQLQEAAELGTDIEITMAEYATYIATTKNHEILARHAKADYSDKTLAQVESEREAFLNELSPELQAEIDQDNAQEPGEFDQIADDVKKHIVEQLEKSGQPINISQFPAELFSAAVPALASRGYNAEQIATAMTNVIVRSPLSTNATVADTIDADITDVLEGNFAKQDEMFGDSLSAWMRSIGITDPGGELAGRDVDMGLPRFTRKMINDETGIELDEAAERALDLGFLTGVTSSEVGPEHLLDALDRELAGEPVFSANKRNEAAIKRNEYLESLQDYISDLGLENATVAEIREAIRQDTLSDQDAVVLAQENGYQGDIPIEARVWNSAVAKGLDMSDEARLARASDMGFDTSQIYHHGSGNIRNILDKGFDPSLTGQGNDQFGSGFYFTTEPTTASGYATDRIQSDIEKLGGEDSPGVVSVYLAVNNPIQVGDAANLRQADIELSADQVRSMLEHSQALTRPLDSDDMNPLGDHYDSFWESGPEEWMLDDIAQRYAGGDIESIEVDLFDGDAGAFRRALFEATGHDGVEVVFEGTGEKHVIAWFPEQIRSINGAFDPEQATSADLLAQDLLEQDDLTVQELPPLPDNYRVNEEPLEIDFTPPTYEQAIADPEQVADETIMELRNIQASVLANKMVKDFDAQHATRLVGEQVQNSHDLAALAQIYRNPSFETFRTFYIKDNKVVHQDGITSRKVGSASVFAQGEDFSRTRELMEQTGADGYYMLHNHPSGNVKSSGADLHVTTNFAEKAPGFLGHVIINGESYTTLEYSDKSSGNESRLVEKQLPLPEDLQNLMYTLGESQKVENEYLSVKVKGSADVARVGKSFQQPGYFTLIGRDSQSMVSTIMDIPLSAVELSPADIQASINKIALTTGTLEFFAANVPEDYRENFNEALKQGVFLDVIAENGISFRQDPSLEVGQPMSGVGRRTMFQGATTAWDAMSDRQREVVTDYLAKLPDGAEKKELLERFAGTPWEKQATAGILTRASIDMLLSGVEPDFESTLRAPSGKKLYNAILKGGEQGIWNYLQNLSFIGHASKPVNAINSSYINCKPSADCANFCYAATGRNFPVNVNKSELITWAVENDPKRAADWVSREYKAMPEFEANKALRLFDKGDGDSAWLPFIKELNGKGVRTHIFSKNPEFLRDVPDINLRLLSIDNSNMEMATDNPDLELAFVYDGSQGAQAFAEMHEKQLGVVLPIKLGKKTTGKAQVDKLTPLAKRKTCPIDSGYKEIGTGQGKWNCTSCDRNGGVGCFDSNTTKSVLDAIANGSGQDLEIKIEELRNVAGQLTGRQREIFLQQLDSLVSTIEQGVEPTTEVYGTKELPRASEKARYKQQERIEIKELFQSAYHGTPHRGIEKFSTENIGTGEGAQAYGWGLYFAQDKRVADFYRKGLVGGFIKDEMSEINYRDDTTEEYEYELDNGSYQGKTKAVLDALRGDDWLGYDRPYDIIGSVMANPDNYDLSAKTKKAIEEFGQLHRVEVPDSDQLLDNELPFDEQPQSVQDKLKARGAFPPNEFSRTRDAIMHNGSGRSIQQALEQDIFMQLGGSDAASGMAPKLASEKLNELGIPGLQYFDGNSRNKDDKSSKNFVIWNDEAIKTAEVFYQGRDEKRGSIELPGNVMTDQTVINLFEKGDLSTFLHESGHFFLELHRELAKQGGEIAQDQELVKQWWHNNAAALAQEAGLTEGQIIQYIYEGKLDTPELTSQAETALHEQWARAFETYLMTGKAPSLKLQGAFQQFKAWLLSIYRSAKRLNVTMSPEIEGVFDRMLASDAEIEQANQAMEYNDVLASSNLLDDDEKEQLKEQSRKATEESQAQLLKVHLREEKAKLTKAYKARREVVEKQVENEVRSRLPYRTQKLIVFGIDPDDNQVDAKLNTKALQDIVGKSAIKMLGKKFNYGKYGITRKDGVNPLSVANTMGYPSVESMVDDLLTLPKLTETVQAETDQIMQAEFLAKQKNAADQAIEAAHGKERQKLLENELDILTTQAGVRTQASQLMQAAAVREINKKTVKSIKPYRYKQAEIKSARDAEKAILAGDVKAARLAKAKQLMNFHLFNEATNALEYVNTAQKGINKYRRSSVRKLVDPVYMEQIDGILFNFEFRQSISQKAFEKSKAIASFVKRQEDDGKSIYLSDKMIIAIEESYKEHYKNLPLSDFKGIDQAIQNLRHLSDVKMELKEQKAQREYAALKEDLLQSIEQNNKPIKQRGVGTDTVAVKFKDKMSAANAYMLSPEQIFRQMDGDKIGPLYNAIFKPVSEAADKAAEWKSNLGTWFNDLANKHYKVTELARFSGAGAKRYPVQIGGREQSLTKEDILGMALNTGNENNRFKLLDGYQMHETELTAVLNLLEKRDWDFVQAIWDKLNSEFWGPLSEVEKRVNGVAPEKVEALPFTNKYGTYAGGYFPIKYDSKEDPQQQKFDDKATLGDVLGQAIHANTRQGHAQARVQQTGKRVRLDFQGVLTIHINDMVQDITHRESVMDVWKLITDREIADQMIRYFGSDVYRTMKPWLAETVGAGKPLATQGQRIISHMRIGMSIVTMGLSVKTALQNISGLFISARHVPKGKLVKNFVTNTIAGMTQSGADSIGWTAKKLGVPDMLVAKYMDRFARNPATFIEQQTEILKMSPYLRQRAGHMDSDVQQQMRKLSIKGRLTPGSQFMFGLITMVDKAVVLPTWQAAYEDAINNKNMNQSEAVTHADHIVRTTQGSARSVDMSRIIADKDTMALFTNFFSYFNAMYSLYWRQKKMFERKGTKHMPQFLAEVFFIVMAPALVAEWLAGRGPDEDDEYAEWALRNTVLYPIMSLPMIRDIATPTYAAFDDTAPQYGYNLSPMSAIGEGVYKSIGAFADGEITEYEAKQMFITPGYFLHLPTVQAWRTGQHTFNAVTGESDFSMYDLLYGEKK